MTKKIYKVSGVVIEKRDWKEKDIIFTLLTPDEGKIEVLAKHAKKVPSRHNSGLELFNGVECQLYQGRLFPVVTQSKQIICFPSLISEYDKLQAGFAMLSLLQKTVASHQPIRQLYPFVYKSLLFLDKNSHDCSFLILVIFKVKLLRMLGLFHTANACESCGKKFGETIAFSHFRYECSHCNSGEKELSLSNKTNNILLMFSEKRLEEILSRSFTTSLLRQADSVITRMMELSLPF